MTLTPTRRPNPIPTLHPTRVHQHPSPLTTARVQAEEEHTAAQEQEVEARRTWTEFDALMAGLEKRLDALDLRIESTAQRLEKCREDLSHLWRSS